MVRVMRAYKNGSPMDKDKRRKYAVPETGNELTLSVACDGRMVNKQGDYVETYVPTETWMGNAKLPNGEGKPVGLRVFRFMHSADDRAIIQMLEKMMAKAAQEQTQVPQIDFDAKIELISPYDKNYW